jgi:DNA ligase-associated metallophosphoesterase
MHGANAALESDTPATGPLTVDLAVNGTAVVCDRIGVLWLPGSATLVVSDLHLEKGAAFARRGMMLPPYDTAATLARLGAAIASYAPRLVISLGDSFHDRSGSAHLPECYREQLQGLQRGRDWVWIEGNHDPDRPVGLEGSFCSELHVESLVFRHEPKSRCGGRGDCRPPSPHGARRQARQGCAQAVFCKRWQAVVDAGIRRHHGRAGTAASGDARLV